MIRKERPQKQQTTSLKSWHQQLVTRRKFIFSSLQLSASTLVSANLFSSAFFASSVNAALAINNKKPSKNTPSFTLNTQQQQTLSAVQNHLFPKGENSPSANDINALTYLQKNILLHPLIETEEKQFLSNGIGWLDDLTKTKFKTSFIQLNTEKKEKLLRAIEKSSAGENWLSTVLLYILEALLSDPIYGGNPNGIGWKWLQHQPGFPHPPAHKIYGTLSI